MNRLTGTILLLLGAIMLTSCGKDNLYMKNVPLDKDGWPADQFIRFEVPVTDILGAYTIFLQVRNDGRYETSNLWLFITTYSPTGATLRDTLECKLADEEGRWLGRGSGGRFSLEIPFRYQVRFPEKGTYLFEIEHGMRTKKLSYITDLGLRIEKAG
ncbi:MAG: gliding motility lipoprotein GldH [Bacteroidota bacterium]